VPRDSGPGLDNVLAGLEDILALDDNLEGRLAVLLLRDRAHDTGRRMS
jgi:hypothetical protein